MGGTKGTVMRAVVPPSDRTTKINGRTIGGLSTTSLPIMPDGTMIWEIPPAPAAAFRPLPLAPAIPFTLTTLLEVQKG